MKHWPPILWAVFVALIIFIVALASVVFSKYYEFGLAAGYVGWIAIIAFWFWWKSQGATDIHIHHYVLSSVGVSCIGYQCVFLTFCQAIFCGVMIEGGSRWGYDPIFTYDGED